MNLTEHGDEYINYKLESLISYNLFTLKCTLFKEININGCHGNHAIVVATNVYPVSTSKSYSHEIKEILLLVSAN